MIIGLVGPAGCGKDTVADVLVIAHAYQRRAFADALKDVAVESFGWDRKKDARGRRMLQALGTEAGRAYDPEIWVRQLHDYIARDPRSDWVIPDVRFHNEAIAIRSWGGAIVRITGRRGHYRMWHLAYWHRSEREARGIVADYALDNSGTVDDLAARIEGLVNLVHGSSGA